ncbi:hypothetical protein MMPV_000323 [Pyropia vietnamensis]
MPSRLGAFLTPAPAGLPTATAGRLPATAVGRRAAWSPTVAARPAQKRRHRRCRDYTAPSPAPRRISVAVLPGGVVSPLLAVGSPPAVVSAVAHLSAATAAAASDAVASTLHLAFTDPWSISAATADAVAAQLFAVSLFPYLAFLYYLSRPEAGCPKGAFRGFAFLLVFVAATIPAGIYAKVVVGDILANVDWLHGSAESLLTITNLLIVGGFRAALAAAPVGSAGATTTMGGGGSSAAAATATATSTDAPAEIRTSPPAVVADNGSGGGEALAAAVITAGVVVIALAGGTSVHAEPANALSLPTWAIHVSSVAEWLIAMGLAWRYAAVSGNEAWKGLAWGMVPLHASGIAACVFHAAYNAPAVGALVALQAALTVVGNTTCAFAAARVARRGRVLAGAPANSAAAVAAAPSGAPSAGAGTTLATVGSVEVEAPVVFWAKVVVGSFLAAAVVKWGELWLNGPFEPTLPVAVAAVVVPTAVNAASWAVRGARERATMAALASAGGGGGAGVDIR